MGNQEHQLVTPQGAAGGLWSRVRLGIRRFRARWHRPTRTAPRILTEAFEIDLKRGLMERRKFTKANADAAHEKAFIRALRDAGFPKALHRYFYLNRATEIWPMVKQWEPEQIYRYYPNTRPKQSNENIEHDD